MRISSFVSYVVAGLFLYLSFWVAEGNHFNLWSFWDISSFIIILGGFLMTLVNFKFSEVFNAFSDALSKNKKEGFEDRYYVNKIVISSIGNYTLSVSVVMFIVSLITIIANLGDSVNTINKAGSSFAVITIVLLYAFMVRLFLVTPLNTSLDKKMSQINK